MTGPRLVTGSDVLAVCRNVRPLGNARYKVSCWFPDRHTHGDDPAHGGKPSRTIDLNKQATHCPVCGNGDAPSGKLSDHPPFRDLLRRNGHDPTFTPARHTRRPVPTPTPEGPAYEVEVIHGPLTTPQLEALAKAYPDIRPETYAAAGVAAVTIRNRRTSKTFEGVGFRGIRERNPGFKVWAVARDGRVWEDEKRVGKPRRFNVGLADLIATPMLREGKPIDRLTIVEGESDLLALLQGGDPLVVTSTAGASDVKALQNSSDALRRWNPKRIMVWGDADTPGREGARKRAEVIKRALPDADVRWVTVPGEPETGRDLRDLLGEGADLETIAKMEADACEMGTQPAVGFIQEPWPSLEPLPPGSEPVPTLTDKFLPDALRPWLADVAERVSIPLEFVAAPALVALGSIVGRSCAIRPMTRDDWQEVPNLWGAIVGPPGVMKSTAISEAMRPLSRLASMATRAFEEGQREQAASLEVLKARRDAVLTAMKTAAKKGDTVSLEATRAELMKLDAEEKQGELTERRFLTSDATIEKLGALLKTNPRGLLLNRDELTGWLRGLDREDRAESRAFFLEAWNGTGRFTVDRIGRGTVHVDGLCVSVVGGIQPGRLRPYVQGAIEGEEGADGLIQRFGLIVWPDGFGEWKALDRWPNREAKDRAFSLFEKLSECEPRRIGAEVEGEDGIPFFRFGPKAQGLFLEWRYEFERRIRSDDLSRTPAFASHLAKYRKLVPAIALLFHLTDAVEGSGNGAVGECSLRLALSWAEFLEAHARKLYASELHPGVSAAHALGAKIEAGDVQEGMTVREIARRKWSGLRTSERVFEATAVLERLGWLRVEAVPSDDDFGRGRPSEVVRLHPNLRGGGSGK